MTIVLVLKPEFTTTFSRGLLRIAGTIAGLFLATALFRFLPGTVTTQLILIFGFTLLLRWVGPANYGIFAAAVSALVVLLIAITGVSPKELIWARGINTAAGGALALFGYWIWPTWERTQVPRGLPKCWMLTGNTFTALWNLCGERNQQPAGTRSRAAGHTRGTHEPGSVDRPANR